MEALRPLLLLFISTFLLSCGSDEASVDLRDKVYGTYTYTKTVYHSFGITSTKGVLYVAPDDKEGRLLLSEEETFYGTTVNAVDSLLTFFIPQQTIQDEVGKIITLHGVKNVKVGEQHCDAGYFPNANRLQLYYQVNFEYQPSQNYSVSLLAIKDEH